MQGFHSFTVTFSKLFKDEIQIFQDNFSGLSLFSAARDLGCALSPLAGPGQGPGGDPENEAPGSSGDLPFYGTTFKWSKKKFSFTLVNFSRGMKSIQRSKVTY